MADNIWAQVRLRTVQSRTLGGNMFLSMLPLATAQLKQTTAARLPSVCLDHLGGLGNTISYFSRLWIARTLAENNHLQEEHRLATTLGELTAYWRLDGRPLPTLRAEVASNLIPALIRPAITQRLTAHLQAMMNIADIGLHDTIVHGVTERMNGQTATCWTTGIYAIPDALLTPEFVGFRREVIMNRGANPIPYHAMGILAADWANIMPTLTPDDIFAVVEVVRGPESRELAIMAHAAALCLIAALCKGQNITDSWIESRWARVCADAGLADGALEPLVSPDVVKAFVAMYDTTALTTDALYTNLFLAAQTFQESGLKSLVWIIEQAAGANVTSAVTFAEALCKVKQIPLEYIIRDIGDLQFKAFIEVCLAVYQDRYCSLKAPPVPATQYADIAILGQAFSKIVLDNRSLRAYKADVKSYATRPTAWAEGIATAVKTMLEQDIDTSIAGEYQEAGNNLLIEGGYVYLPAEDLEQDRQVPARVHADEVDEAIQARIRASWPVSMRAMPANWTRITMEQHRGRKQDTAKTASVKYWAQKLVQSVAQTSIPLLRADQLAIADRRRAVDDEGLVHLGVWGIRHVEVRQQVADERAAMDFQRPVPPPIARSLGPLEGGAQRRVFNYFVVAGHPAPPGGAPQAGRIVANLGADQLGDPEHPEQDDQAA